MDQDRFGRRAVFCQIIPPYLLERVAEQADTPQLREQARLSLELDSCHRQGRLLCPSGAVAERATTVAAEPPAPERTISDAQHRERLPGRRVRVEGQDPTADASVNQAYDGLGHTFRLFLEVYGRDSIDGTGLPLNATVHFGRDYDNAFWNGEQMVFGDGDGRLFTDFTKPVDVIGHELTHGVTQYSADLAYQGQSGALNESVSDVFGALVKQYALGQRADQADWLIGAGLLGPGINGIALRSMKEPGTAFDDPLLGKDPQPGSMADYVDTEEDHGGVHINSGIPNRAFYLVATALGGHAWERAGQVWYDTLTGPQLTPASDFTAFARATVEAAKARYGDGAERGAVADAWGEVGVRL